MGDEFMHVDCARARGTGGPARDRNPPPRLRAGSESRTVFDSVSSRFPSSRAAPISDRLRRQIRFQLRQAPRPLPERSSSQSRRRRIYRRSSARDLRAEPRRSRHPSPGSSTSRIENRALVAHQEKPQLAVKRVVSLARADLHVRQIHLDLDGPELLGRILRRHCRECSAGCTAWSPRPPRWPPIRKSQTRPPRHSRRCRAGKRNCPHREAAERNPATSL